MKEQLFLVVETHVPTFGIGDIYHCGEAPWDGESPYPANAFGAVFHPFTGELDKRWQHAVETGYATPVVVMSVG